MRAVWIVMLCFPLQDYVVTKRLASVFSHCYGGAPVPAVPPMDVTLSTQLGNASQPRNNSSFSTSDKHLKDFTHRQFI